MAGQRIYAHTIKQRRGETAAANYTPYPSPAKLGSLSFEKSAGPESEISILKSDENDGTVNIIVPDDAQVGTYYYRAAAEGMESTYVSSIKITVMPDRFDIVLSAENGSGKTITKTVQSGAEYILPGCPEEFEAPENMDFAGWDIGAAGSKITVNEPLTLKAQWKPHEHTMEYVPSIEPSCTETGMEEYYRCLVCGKLFEDDEGKTEAPNTDHFKLPPKGHTPGEIVRENIKDADCEHDGSFESAVYCKDCGEPLSRTMSLIPAYGHEWGAPKWSWSDNSTEAALVFTCVRDASHTKAETAAVTSETTPATAKKDGQIVYTAKVTLDGEELEDTRTVVIPKLTDSDTDEPKPNGICGDVDGDGTITASDALMILRASVGTENLTPEQTALADVDGDGNITANDALTVLRHSAGMVDGGNIGKPITA